MYKFSQIGIYSGDEEEKHIVGEVQRTGTTTDRAVARAPGVDGAL